MTGRCCVECGREMRNRDTEHDDRPVYAARGMCSRCYSRWTYRARHESETAAHYRPRQGEIVDDDDHDWMDLAACREYDPELFYPTPGENPAAPLSVCRGCDVVAECLELALATEWPTQRYGVWGGRTAAQRSRLHRRRLDVTSAPGITVHITAHSDQEATA